MHDSGSQWNSDRAGRTKVRSRRGFTMIEILVVVVIAGIIAGIAMPGFVRATRGAQLRTASRTVLMAHKYARSTAVLRQTQMALLIDSVGKEIEIVSLTGGPNSLASRGAFLDSRASRAAQNVLDDDSGSSGPAPAIASELVRRFGKDVKVEAFSSERGDQELEGYFWVNYYPNGMSDGFELTMADESGKRAVITTEGISGSAEVEFPRW